MRTRDYQVTVSYPMEERYYARLAGIETRALALLDANPFLREHGACCAWKSVSLLRSERHLNWLIWQLWGRYG